MHTVLRFWCCSSLEALFLIPSPFFALYSLVHFETACIMSSHLSILALRQDSKNPNLYYYKCNIYSKKFNLTGGTHTRSNQTFYFCCFQSWCRLENLVPINFYTKKKLEKLAMLADWLKWLLHSSIHGSCQDSGLNPARDTLISENKYPYGRMVPPKLLQAMPSWDGLDMSNNNFFPETHKLFK